MPDVDFTSAHFLALAPTGTAAALTTGRPAAAERNEPGVALARWVARVQGATDGVLGRTSLHVLLDVVATRPAGAAIAVDEALYPVGRWAAWAAGAEVVTFRHHDARDAAHVLARVARRGPVVMVMDGLCGSCLRPAPLAELADVARRYGGELVVDDTLAAGVLGRRGPAAPLLGSGGGGTAAWLGVPTTNQVTVSSLAKGLSAPLAVVTGPADRIALIRRDGPTRVHAGPPTAADVAALTHALRHHLDARRDRLGNIVTHARRVLDGLGLPPLGIPFPVVLTEGGPRDPLELHRALAASGVHTLATLGRCTGRPALSLCLRADHTAADLDRLERALAVAVSWRPA